MSVRSQQPTTRLNVDKPMLAHGQVVKWVTLPVQPCNSGLRLFSTDFMIFPTLTLLRARTAQKTIPRLQSLPSNYSPLFSPNQVQCRRLISRFFRPKAVAKVETPGVKRAYGERVLIYYAGQRIVFVATLKLATLFVFSFCTFVAAPSVSIDTEYGYLAPIGSRFSIHFLFLVVLEAADGSCMSGQLS